MTDKWYEPAAGLTLSERLRRPLVSHAPEGAITNADLARQLVDDRSDALVRIEELEARITILISGAILPADAADEITVDGVRWVRVPAEKRVKFY